MSKTQHEAAPAPDRDRLSASTAATNVTTDATPGLPTSFGTFNPVGYVMMGLPTLELADTLMAALHDAGWGKDTVRHFLPRDGVTELQALVDNAGVLAGFGYEITVLRRYLELARHGYRWLLVKVDDGEHATAASEVARARGATLAVYYRALTVEELI